MAVSAFVSDFDGTITRNDFYSLIAERYVHGEVPDYFEQYRRGEISHIQAMQGFFQHAPDDAAALEALMRDTEPDPGAASAFDRLQKAGWEVIIVSAGSSWYIEKILAKLNVQATVHSNPGRIERGRGLQLDLPRESLFFSEDVGLDKSAVVRHAIAHYAQVAFAGDGPPDVAPALLVAPELRFARGYLAGELRHRGEEFRTFDSWSEIADALVAGK